MRFDYGPSIYRQIVEYVEEEIAKGRWSEETRLPAVRELAVQLGVNPNTVQRSYSALQDGGLIYNQRGVGYFVASEAQDRARRMKRERFEAEVLPRVFETMETIGISDADLIEAHTRWTARNGGRE